MNEFLDKMTSLAIAVVFSPELLLLGLWLAASRDRGVQKAWAYFFGGTTGLMTLALIGFMLGSGLPEGPSWGHFIARAVLSIVIALLGLHVLLKKSAPKDPSNVHHDVEKVGTPLAFLFGFLITTINIKITAIGLAAGKELLHSTLTDSEKIKGSLLFVGISDIPIVLPALIESVRRGISGRIINPCCKFVESFGKWIVAVILFLIAFEFFKHALKVMP